MNQLQRAVLALAQTAEVQISLFPDFVCQADELALDFDDAMLMVASMKDGFNVAQRATLEDLHALLSNMGGAQNAELWTIEALHSHPSWEVIRGSAKAAAAAFGWKLEVPPPSGAIYIHGR